MGERKTFHFDFNKNYSVEVNFSESESLIKAFRSAEISRNPSLTLHNVGNIEGLDLNANFDRYITDITDITSAGASYSFGKNCGFTISGECSDKSITTTLMVTEKRTGIGFGIEYKLTGDVKTLTVQKHEFSFVIKASIGGEEITLKFVFLKVPGADAVAGGNNSDKAQKPNKDGDPENDGNGSSDSDKSGAAKAECDSILIDVDFVNGKICQKVVTYIFEKAVQDQTLLLAENVGTPELVQEIPVVDNSLNMVPTEVRREENNTAQDVGVQELVQEIPVVDNSSNIVPTRRNTVLGRLRSFLDRVLAPTAMASGNDSSDSPTAVAPVFTLGWAPVLAPTTAAPVLSQTTVAPVLAQTTVAPVLAQTTVAPVLAQTTVAPVLAQTTVAPVLAQTTVAPVLAQTTVAPVFAETTFCTLQQMHMH